MSAEFVMPTDELSLALEVLDYNVIITTFDVYNAARGRQLLGGLIPAVEQAAARGNEAVARALRDQQDIFQTNQLRALVVDYNSFSGGFGTNCNLIGDD